MPEIITSKEAAAILKERLGFKVSASFIYTQAMRKFPHLAVRNSPRSSSGGYKFKGINKSAWLNFLGARHEAKSSQELFNMEP